MESIGLVACGILIPVFVGLALVFYLMKGKAVFLISGFNTLPKTERETYDIDRLVLDSAKELMLWTVIMAIGALASAFICRWIFVIAYIVWVVLIFKNFKLDARKAFAKYKLTE